MDVPSYGSQKEAVWLPYIWVLLCWLISRAPRRENSTLILVFKFGILFLKFGQQYNTLFLQDQDNFQIEIDTQNYQHTLISFLLFVCLVRQELETHIIEKVEFPTLHFVSRWKLCLSSMQSCCIIWNWLFDVY